MNNIIGRKFGRLTVLDTLIKKLNNKKNPNRIFCKCQCDCGNLFITRKDGLLNNRIKSCGCLRNINRDQKMLDKYNQETVKIKSAQCLYRDVYSDGNLTFDDFLQLTQQNCFYCNTLPKNKHTGFKKNSMVYKTFNTYFVYNGLDRIDSTLPHNKENVLPCCFQCNWAKNDKTINEFVDWLQKLCNISATNKFQY